MRYVALRQIPGRLEQDVCLAESLFMLEGTLMIQSVSIHTRPKTTHLAEIVSVCDRGEEATRVMPVRMAPLVVL